MSESTGEILTQPQAQPGSELKNRYFAVSFPKDLPPESRIKSYDAHTFIEGLNVVDFLVHKELQNPLKAEELDIDRVRGINNMVNRFTAFMDHIGEIEQGLFAGQVIFEEAGEKLGINRELLPRDTIIDELPVNSDVQLDAIIELLPKMRHDMRSPFTAIKTFAELVELRASAGREIDKTEAADTINRNLRKAVEVIGGFGNDMRGEFPTREFRVHQVVHQIREDVETYMVNNDMKFDLKFEGDQDEIEYERLDWSTTWMTRLFMNIRDNQKRYVEPYNKKRGTTTELSVTVRKNPDTNNLELIFEDNGPGFTPGILQNGFESGKSENPEEGEEPIGQGQGMATSTDVLKEHYHGDCRVENNIMKNSKDETVIMGSKLTIIIPLK